MSEENLQEKKSSNEGISIPALEKFIFRPDIFEASVVPRKLASEDVAKFLLEKVEANATLKNFIQIEKVAWFYETNEVVEKFKGFLNKKEANSEEVRRSIVITRIIARLGEKEELNFAKDYYKFLVGRAESKADFEELILLYDALGPDAEAAILHQRIKTRSSELEAKKDSDEASRVAYLELAGNVTNKLTRAEKAQLVKSRILNLSDRKQRIEAEIKAYLTIEYGYTEFLEMWAAARLRRETWAVQPAEQIKRTDNSQLREDVAKLIGEFLRKLDDVPNLDKEEKTFAKIRALRAIKFFGGKVSESEETFLKQYKNEQMDVLANEGFFIKE